MPEPRIAVQRVSLMRPALPRAAFANQATRMYGCTAQIMTTMTTLKNGKGFGGGGGGGGGYWISIVVVSTKGAQ